MDYCIAQSVHHPGRPHDTEKSSVQLDPELTDLPYMTPLHIEPSDPPEKRLDTMDCGVSIQRQCSQYVYCVVASAVSVYYCWMTRNCPFLRVKVYHNVCS